MTEYKRTLARRLNAIRVEKNLSIVQLAAATEGAISYEHWRKILDEDDDNLLQPNKITPALLALLGEDLWKCFPILDDFVVSRRPGSRVADFITAIAHAAKECGEAQAMAASAIGDGLLPSEAAPIKREINQAIRALVALDAAVDAAVIDPLPRRAGSER